MTMEQGYCYPGYNVRHARRLFENGFVTVPADGKAIYLENWQDFGLYKTPWEKLEQIARTIAPGHNISHVFGPESDLVGVDIDITDPGTSKKVQRLAQRMLGCTPFVRVGRWPKVAWYYRKSKRGEHRSIKTTRLEIFSDSGQMVWFGDHPVTNRPYMWPDKSPMQCDSGVCPVVSPEMVAAFVSAAKKVISEFYGDVQPGNGKSDMAEEMVKERKGKYNMDYKRVLLEQLTRMSPGKGNRHRIIVSVIGSMLAKGYNKTEIVKFLYRPYITRWQDGTNRMRKVEKIIRGFERRQARQGGKK